jgi:hypothetical protein
MGGIRLAGSATSVQACMAGGVGDAHWIARPTGGGSGAGGEDPPRQVEERRSQVALPPACAIDEERPI